MMLKGQAGRATGSRVASALTCIVLLGCAERAIAPTAEVPSESTPLGPPAASSSAPSAALGPAPFDWSGYRGRCVVVQGYASGGGKTEPRIEGGAWSIALTLADPPGEEGWWAVPLGARVEVQGVVGEGRDPRVFVQKAGEPIAQGIPVPEGTDVDKASRRYLLEGATVKLLRTMAEVEGELTAQLGRDVRLPGVVWSLNGHWWFRHDGVDLHVEAVDSIPGWRQMHGTAATLAGRLERRPMPRLDQIALKANRDIADAFVLTVREMSAHPALPVRDCPPATADRAP